MRVIPGGIHKSLGVYRTQDTKKDIKTNSLSTDRKQDKVELSDRAQAFRAALDSIKKSADIREDKVRALKHEIQSGRYKVDSVELARRILQEHCIDKKDW
ncbi:MAG TPA: flagellar biosynthesis anti-sigma factor FlgM [Clostridiales bacterium]|nr:flagellar biosynthesis anti-sigma factor FlgM [Clostridiales bacterium]